MKEHNIANNTYYLYDIDKVIKERAQNNRKYTHSHLKDNLKTSELPSYETIANDRPVTNRFELLDLS